MLTPNGGTEEGVTAGTTVGVTVGVTANVGAAGVGALESAVGTPGADPGVIGTDVLKG